MNSNIVNLYPKPNHDSEAMKMLTVSSSVVKLTSGGYTFHDNTRYVTLDVQDNDVRVTYTDEDPVTTGTVKGHILYAGNSYTWSKQAAQTAKFKAVGGDAIIAASQFTY